MSDIKTRDRNNHNGSGSRRNPALGAAMKKVYFRTKEQAEQAAGAEYEEAEAYAYEEAETNAAELLETTVDIAKSGAGMAVRSERERIKTRRTAEQIKGEAAADEAIFSAERPSASGNGSAVRKTSDISADSISAAPAEQDRRATPAEKGKQLAQIKQREKIRTKQREKPVGGVGIKQATTSVRFAEKTGLNARVAASPTIRTANAAQKATAMKAKALADSQRAKAIAKQTSDKAKKASKAAARALKAAIKGTITAAKSLVGILMAGGSVALIVICVICLVGLIVASAYGIFAGNEVSKATDGDTSRDLRAAITEINSEYYERIQDIRGGVENLDKTTIKINGEVGAMTGVWQDVLAVYSVKTAHGDDATIAIDFDATKKEKLRSIFWDMVSISYRVTERKVMEETPILEDAQGVAAVEMTEVIYRDVTINVTTKSAVKASELYSFTGEQNKVLAELMSDQFTNEWSDLIYGYSYGDEDIVAVAISQIGNVGGAPYWRWYGLSERTAWCAIFVSWCADQCGYLDTGIIPKFAWVPDGVAWFQSRGQWQPRGYTPAPGDIIFFDWEHNGGMDHVGIVEYCENGVVHTIEGNTGDACKRKQYSVNSRSILGYGLPIYS